LETTGILKKDELELGYKVIKFLLTQNQTDSSRINENSDSVPSVKSLIPETLTAEEIQTWLTQQIASELGVKPSEIDIQASFDSYGLDSLLALSIASKGQQFLGFEVSPLVLMHYGNIASLSNYLAAEFAANDTEIFEL
jgi:acyl carrier protein